MVPGVGVVGPAGSALPSEFSALLPPRYALGCDGMPNISVGAGGVCATAVPTNPTVAALASKQFPHSILLVPRTCPATDRPGQTTLHIAGICLTCGGVWSGVFPGRNMPTAPSRNETCAIVEHLWLLSNTRAERRRQGPQPAARASSQGPPPRTFPHRSNSLQRRATLDHGRVRDGAQRISSGAPSEEPGVRCGQSPSASRKRPPALSASSRRTGSERQDNGDTQRGIRWITISRG